MGRLKGAVFDLDGTLVDSEGLKYRSLVRVLRDHGVELGYDEFVTEWVGYGKGFRDGLARHGLMDRHDEIWADQTRLYLGYIRDELELAPGALDALAALRARGLRIGLATGSRRRFMDATVDRFGLRIRLDAMVSGSDVGNNKPAPDVYVEATRRLGLMPMQCVAFEDSRGGIESAKGAGLLCVVVPNRFTAAQDLSGAHLRIDSLDRAVWAVEELERRF